MVLRHQFEIIILSGRPFKVFDRVISSPRLASYIQELDMGDFKYRHRQPERESQRWTRLMGAYPSMINMKHFILPRGDCDDEFQGVPAEYTLAPKVSDSTPPPFQLRSLTYLPDFVDPVTVDQLGPFLATQTQITELHLNYDNVLPQPPALPLLQMVEISWTMCERVLKQWDIVQLKIHTFFGSEYFRTPNAMHGSSSLRSLWIETFMAPDVLQLFSECFPHLRFLRTLFVSTAIFLCTLFSDHFATGPVSPARCTVGRVDKT